MKKLKIPWITSEYRRRLKKYFDNIDEIIDRIKQILDKEFGEGNYEVFLFGSVAENDYTLASDIDILVVSNKVPPRSSERAKILAKIFKEIGIDAPLEIHLAKPEQLEWYRRFAKKMIKK